MFNMCAYIIVPLSRHTLNVTDSIISTPGSIDNWKSSCTGNIVDLRHTKTHRRGWERKSTTGKTLASNTMNPQSRIWSEKYCNSWQSQTQPYIHKTHTHAHRHTHIHTRKENPAFVLFLKCSRLLLKTGFKEVFSSDGIKGFYVGNQQKHQAF